MSDGGIMSDLDIPMLDGVANAEIVLERIESAARQAMLKITMERLTLEWNGQVPTLNQVRRHLAELVGEAINDFHLELQHAPAGFLPEDVTGEADDEVFEVWLSGEMNDKVEFLFHVHINQKLGT